MKEIKISQTIWRRSR